MFRIIRRATRGAIRGLTRRPALPGPGGLVTYQRTPAVHNDFRGDERAAIAEMERLVWAEHHRGRGAAPA